MSSGELEAENDVFVDDGVLYCACGNPIESEDGYGLIKKDAGREFVECPTCDLRYFAEGGSFARDD